MVENKKLTRREREKLRQRQEILSAALDLFPEKGYQNVSMREVAEKAEFAIGTLYKFFQNKEDLYKALILEQCDKFESALVRAIEKSNDEVEKLRNYIRAKGDWFRSNLPLIRLFLAESRGVSFSTKAGLDEEVRKRYYHLLERVASIFESGIKNKKFKRTASPYHLAVALDSIVDSFFLLGLKAPEQCPYPEDPNTILNILFKELINT
jgi:AcrR family transcriptional regulator